MLRLPQAASGCQMATQLLLVSVALGLAPEEALERALAAVEPAPALRASFRARVASDLGVREIVFDPQAVRDRFTVVLSDGVDPDLDLVVEAWRAERQPDVRLFADDLRASIGAGRLVEERGGWSLAFRHQLTANHSVVDALVSSRMVGRLTLDPETGWLSELEFRVDEPLQIAGGVTLDELSQTYAFARSELWNVSFIRAYRIDLRAGRLGVGERRRFEVTLSDVEFLLAGDAVQELVSKE
jgi:hypothetical protein